MKKVKSLVFIAIMAIAVFAAPLVVFANDTVTILHTNDIHGRFVESSTAIGMDTIATISDMLPNSILVDAGDTIHGMPFVNFNKGYNAVALMNMAGYSFMVPGNHDFNFGITRLLELENTANFTFLAKNVLRDGQYVFTPYQIVDFDGITLGFFGLAYPGTPVVTHPDNVAGLDFGNPVVAAQEAVAALEEVDVIVALAHLGVDGSAWVLEVAQQVPEINIIIDGHSHTTLEDGLMVGDVLIVQSGAHAQNIGRIDITVADGDVTTVASLITQEYALENFEPRVDVQAVIHEMNRELGEVLDVVVGYNPVTFYGDSPEHRAILRSQEVPIGNLIADSMRWGTGADLALANSGGIRYHLHAGDVTKGDIIEVLAFFNYAVVVEITAAQLWEALENGVSNMPGNGRFPQVSGFSFVFDQNAEEGNRVVSVTTNGQELASDDNETTFSIAINNFVAAGGDGYEVFEDLPRLGEFGTQDELLIAYMAVTDLTAVGIEGRIVDLAAGEETVYEPEPTEDPVYELEPVYVPELIPIREVEPEEIEPEEVELIEIPIPTPAPVAGTGTVVNCWFLNVRAGGSPQCNVINVLSVGDVVIIHETNTWNWHRIELGEITGWVYGGYIEVN